MSKSNFINQLSEQISNQLSSLFKNNITQDVEHNVKAILTSIFTKLDLVTREEFEVQQKVLAHTRQKLEELEKTVDQLLNQSHKKPTHKDK